MVVTIGGMVRCVVTLEVKVADSEIVVIASCLMEGAEIVIQDHLTYAL